MTKAIRIENADNSTHKVQVRVMQASLIPGEPDVCVETVDLSCPTQLINKTIWKGKYLIVEEVD